MSDCIVGRGSGEWAIGNAEERREKGEGRREKGGDFRILEFGLALVGQSG